MILYEYGGFAILLRHSAFDIGKLGRIGKVYPTIVSNLQGCSRHGKDPPIPSAGQKLSDDLIFLAQSEPNLPSFYHHS